MGTARAVQLSVPVDVVHWASFWNKTSGRNLSLVPWRQMLCGNLPLDRNGRIIPDSADSDPSHGKNRALQSRAPLCLKEKGEQENERGREWASGQESHEGLMDDGLIAHLRRSLAFFSACYMAWPSHDSFHRNFIHLLPALPLQWPECQKAVKMHWCYLKKRQFLLVGTFTPVCLCVHPSLWLFYVL